ncbi:MAG TPA: PD-(D/E)XK nuclease family protein [Gaiellaceae bacterium]|nr:PD-(D/E)XK nuclease family protein [Gaiellaceae bacterium]
MGLSLVVGPAKAGKVALLLERYLARLDDEPFLIVPTGSDVERVERDLLARCGCLLGGSIGTFDRLFERLVGADPERKPVATRAQRALIARRAVQNAVGDGAALSASARFGGFADALVTILAELEGGLLEPADLDGDLAILYAAYRAELDGLGLWDRDLLRRRACDRLLSDLDAWHHEPVFAYGFEDLTAAEWALLEALSGRADVHASLPYEPGRAAFASLARTAEDLGALAAGTIEELPPRSAEYAAPALAHLERALYEPDAQREPTGGAVRFLAGAGLRGTLELIGDELLTAIRDGTAPEQIGLVVPSVERWRAPLETVFGGLGIPYAIEARVRFTVTPLGHALISLLRFAWAGGGRRELYGYLRSPYSGIARTGVDFAEGRLRGRAVELPSRVEEETERLREAPLVALRELREADSPLEGVRIVLESMVRAAYGLESPPAGDQARLDLRCFGAAGALLDELAALGAGLETGEVIDALARLDLSAPASEPGRVAILDLLRARTRSFDTVFVLGLEEGALPRRGRSSPFLDDDRRRELGARLERPDQVSRDRYLFYTACTRASRRLYLVRQAATDEGSPLEASPFWEDVAAVFLPEDVERATRRRALSELTWPIEAAPTERERLRALARLSADPDATELALALAETNGWMRRLGRARRAFIRDTRLRNPAVLGEFGGRTTFGATELERFGDCSSAWLFERVVDPKTIDAEADAMLRGKVAHQALYAFYSGLPKELGADRVTPETLEQALRFLVSCLDDALGSGVRLELGEVDAAELRESLRGDLERFVRAEAESKLAFQPRRFELGFGTDRSAPELQRGLELGDGLFLSGKIDRIDIDPLSARGIVQDYKSGKGSFSARQIDQERRLQIPLYMLVLRDLAGIEPLGGVYRALSGARAARGMLRAEARDELPGFKPNDYLDEGQFWAQVETARERALGAARRIRAGDVVHDPKGGECPSWCDLWTMCRVPRA